MMKWISSFSVLYLLRLASAVCECENGQQAVIPSDITITAPRPFNNTDGSPSSFGSACVDLTSSYLCTSNTGNPLFDCSTDNNSYYGWNTSIVIMFANFTSHFQSMNVLVTFLISTSSNASVPTVLQYLTSRDGINVSTLNQDNLPTNLPEGPYQRNFTLSPGMMFNQIFITISPNTAFEWVAIGRIVFCAATIEDHNVTFSSVMSTASVSSTVLAAVSTTTSSSSLTVSTMSHTVSSTTMSNANTTAGGPLSSSKDSSVSVGVIIGAAVGALLLITVVLLLVIMLLYGRKRQSNIDDKGVAIEMNDHNSQQPTPNTAGKSQHNHSDKDVLSQVVNVDPESRLERVNELYIPSKVESLNSLDQGRSIPMASCDVTVTPNPSYAVSPNLPQTRKKSEQQYDYIQSDNELVQHDEFGYLQLVGSATSDGVYDDIVTDPTRADNVNIGLNPSQGGQDVELEDNPSYDKLQL